MSSLIVELYLERLWSIPQIAQHQKIPRSRVRGLLIEAGITLRSRADGVRLRKDVLGVHMRGTSRPHTDAVKKKLSELALRRGEISAKGVRTTPSGYIEFTRGPHKGRSQHVITMEERIGRHLKPDEVVHHIDGNRANNSEDNLALMTRAAHTRLHRREEQLAKGQSWAA